MKTIFYFCSGGGGRACAWLEAAAGLWTTYLQLVSVKTYQGHTNTDWIRRDWTTGDRKVSVLTGPVSADRPSRSL